MGSTLGTVDPDLAGETQMALWQGLVVRHAALKILQR